MGISSGERDLQEYISLVAGALDHARVTNRISSAWASVIVDAIAKSR